MKIYNIDPGFCSGSTFENVLHITPKVNPFSVIRNVSLRKMVPVTYWSAEYLDISLHAGLSVKGKEYCVSEVS